MRAVSKTMIAAGYHTGDAALTHNQLFGDKSFIECDGLCLAHFGDERVHDGATRTVARNPYDPARRMCGFTRLHKTPFEVAVKRNTVTQEIAHTLARFLRHAACHRLVNKARTRNHRIACVKFGAVTFRERGCDSALRPCR